MGVVRGTYDLHKEAHRDAQRHREKLKDAFKERLHDIISEESIISSDGNKKVKVPIRSLDNYRFVFDPKQGKGTGQGDGNTKEGDIVSREKKKGDGTGKGKKAGEEEGEDIYEAEVDLDDLVEMMMEDLNLPRLDPKKKADLTVPHTEWNDISRRGAMSLLDKKRTIIENMKRNARLTGVAKVEGINKDDLRFRSWTEEQKPVTSAAIILMMDVSGSMYMEKKYIARALSFWMVQFLRRKYQEVEIVFIAHTTTAKIVSEDDFFHKGESGGTKCSSAYELALETIKRKYDPSLWNTFAFHFSDGETWGDEEACVKLLLEMSELCNMIGYGEIDTDDYGGDWGSLRAAYEEAPGLVKLKQQGRFVQAYMTHKDDVYPVLRKFFGEDYG
jgi:sporulation protein YhbH